MCIAFMVIATRHWLYNSPRMTEYLGHLAITSSSTSSGQWQHHRCYEDIHIICRVFGYKSSSGCYENLSRIRPENSSISRPFSYSIRLHIMNTIIRHHCVVPSNITESEMSRIIDNNDDRRFIVYQLSFLTSLRVYHFLSHGHDP